MPVEMEMTLDLLGRRLGGRNGVWMLGGFIVTGMGNRFVEVVWLCHST